MTLQKKRKIFLDVGTHIGQTLEEVTKPCYDFDLIMSFEPSVPQFLEAVKRYGDKALIFNFGLYHSSGWISLFGDNANMGASIFKEKNDVDDLSRKVLMYEVSSLFNTFSNNDCIIMKLNCEGSEIAIMNDLIDNGQIWKLWNVMIDFDIKKVPGKEHLADELINRMDSIGFNRYSLCENVMIGKTHQDRIRHWLKTVL